MESYTLNGAENLLLNVCVSNDGEHAYDAITTLDMPEDVNLVRLHSNRSTLDWHEFRVEQSGRNRLEISLGNPMIAFTKVIIAFKAYFIAHLTRCYTFADLLPTGIQHTQSCS